METNVNNTTKPQHDAKLPVMRGAFCWAVTYQQESQATKYLFFRFLILVAVGFIVGNIILSTL